MLVTDLFFDFDGVLLDSVNFHAEAFNNAFSNFNIPLGEFQYVSGRSSESLVRDYLNQLYIFDEQKIRSIIQEKQKIVRNEIEINLPIFPNEIQVLIKLSNSYKLSIVSSSTYHLIGKFLEKYNLENAFTNVISFEMTRQSKPSPEPYLLALKKNNVNCEQVLVIEDSISGIESAVRAGLKYITFSPTGELLNKNDSIEGKCCKSYDQIYEHVTREMPNL
jgi:beta-phosphoglucomutase